MDFVITVSSALLEVHTQDHFFFIVWTTLEGTAFRFDFGELNGTLRFWKRDGRVVLLSASCYSSKCVSSLWNKKLGEEFGNNAVQTVSFPLPHYSPPITPQSGWISTCSCLVIGKGVIGVEIRYRYLPYSYRLLGIGQRLRHDDNGYLVVVN
ncbi:hypothetical protein CEXT_403931 [Caerostris extrusa]|uniref:Uncharacterized protein n=1 Tax=Caerostris extrusa TaxID=172846 RepID=A0AAV4RPS7_CAEEX|nr:hypothetical protein CEXT_403931 [Caerostris extrusa]